MRCIFDVINVTLCQNEKHLLVVCVGSCFLVGFGGSVFASSRNRDRTILYDFYMMYFLSHMIVLTRELRRRMMKHFVKLI